MDAEEPTAAEDELSQQAAWELNSLFHRSARLLPLNPLPVLLDLGDILVEVCANLCNEPANTKYHKIRMGNKTMQARIFSRPGGLEFLGAIGFRTGLIGGEKHLILDLPVLLDSDKRDSVNDSDTGAAITVFDSITRSSSSSSSSSAAISADVERIRIGSQWLQETLSSCVSMHGLCAHSAIERSNAPASCAETLIQIRFPGGVVAQGGFMRDDTVEDILQFARCFYRFDKASSVVLRLPYDASIAISDTPNLSIDQAKLYPRAVLVASTDATTANRSLKMSTNHDKVKENMNNRLAAAVKAKELKAAQQKEERRHRESVLLSFRDDREDKKEKRRI